MGQTRRLEATLWKRLEYLSELQELIQDRTSESHGAKGRPKLGLLVASPEATSEWPARIDALTNVLHRKSERVRELRRREGEMEGQMRRKLGKGHVSWSPLFRHAREVKTAMHRLECKRMELVL